MKRVLFAALVITALLLSLAGPVAAAPTADNPGKGPPEISKAVFVHYPQGKAWETGDENGGGKLWYKYTGVHWASSDLPVVYLVNLDGVADPDKTAFLEGIQAGFETWEDVDGSYMDFDYIEEAPDLLPGNLDAT
ncbi:hypothetical protein ES705_37720 [subsurface metagenome]